MQDVGGGGSLKRIATFDRGFFEEFEMDGEMRIGTMDLTFLDDEIFDVNGTLVVVFRFDHEVVEMFYSVDERMKTWEFSTGECDGVDEWTFKDGDIARFGVPIARLRGFDFVGFVKGLHDLIGCVCA